MVRSRIPYTKPSITNLERRYALDAVENGWGERCYEYIDRFEEALARLLGVKHVVATSSCTGALHLGLAALNIGPGDEVILADSNWVATAAPIVHLGARPVFVDILKDSWCIDPELVEHAISEKTRAIIATHLYGNMADMGRLNAIGEAWGIPVIEDAAEAIGSSQSGKAAGGLGALGVVSFHGTKTITTGEGGAFVTNNSELYEHVRVLNNHGRMPHQERQFWPEVVGYKYRMANVPAAIGCGQVERADELVARKREIMNYYRNALQANHGLSLNPVPINGTSGFWMPTVVFDEQLGITREMLIAGFAREDIDARVFFWPLSATPPFDEAETPNAHSIPGRAVNLPSFHDITEQELERVIDTLAMIVERQKN